MIGSGMASAAISSQRPSPTNCVRCSRTRLRTRGSKAAIARGVNRLLTDRRSSSCSGLSRVKMLRAGLLRLLSDVDARRPR